MKKAILIVLFFCSLAIAESITSVGVLGGYGYTKYYEGGTFGVRLERTLNNYLSVGIETVSGISMQHIEAARDEDADFMRLHAVLKLSTHLGKFEPYLMGSFGKGIVAENLSEFSELSAPGSGSSRANTAWGGGINIGARFHFKNAYLGCEWGLTNSVLDYGQAAVLFGFKF